MLDPVADYFINARPEIAVQVPTWAKRVLDVGCGAGYLGKELKERGVAEVMGIELDPAAAEHARRHLDAVYTGDVNQITLPVPPGYFDVIIFADILEHLVNPALTMAHLMPWLATRGCVIASLPNVRYFELLNHLIEGNWTYSHSGLLDKTHLRFFTIREMVQLFNEVKLPLTGIFENLHEAAYQQHCPNHYPADFQHGRLTLAALNEFEFRDLFVFQYILVATRS